MVVIIAHALNNSKKPVNFQAVKFTKSDESLLAFIEIAIAAAQILIQRNNRLHLR